MKIIYYTEQGQTWDMVARAVYGNEGYVDFLMKNNPKQLDYFVFPKGIGLNIVEISEELEDMPPWRCEDGS